ncbi:MAG: hypothetical protein ACI93R_003780 [Flavobacteriales bacterium]|jgi:hypothetical protein
MYALTPLLFILLTLNSKQLKDDWEYRFKVFALVGAFHFSIFQFLNYTFHILQSQGIIQIAANAFCVLAIVTLCLSQYIKKSNITVSVVVGFISMVLIVANFFFSAPVKNVIADRSGYYSSFELKLPYRASLPEKSVVHIFDVGGYSLRLPESWEEKKLNTGHPYFIKMNGVEKVAEIRPRCSPPGTIDIPTLVENLQILISATGGSSQFSCHVNEGVKQCYIEGKYDSKERWFWFQLDENKGREIEALFYQDDAESKRDAIFAMASVEYIAPVDDVYLLCSTPSEWF